MDISDWLEQNGLGKYASVFTENEIDLIALPEITEGDLREMGLPIGPRRKLLKAARDLSHAVSTSYPVDSSRSRDVGGERRQLTVMFCDLVGSTALSEQLDPEELQAVVRTYQEISAGVIERYAGHIAQYLGDGLLVYFGYPAAHEDDAARAIRAGLEIVTALNQARTQFPQPVHVRIAIHTGPVVVGQMGGGSRHEQLALGETPIIAARAQGKADPDTVVISATTFRLVLGLFTYQDLGLHDLKGISTAQPLYQVQAESADQNRFEVSVRTGLTPLVGRSQELELLVGRWEQVTAGDGHVVLVSGEAGIGKSRLVQALKDRVIREGARRIEFRCSPYHQNTPLYPIIDNMQRLLRFQREDTSQTKLTKLEQALTRYTFPRADTLALLIALFSLPHPKGVPELDLSPQKQKHRTLEALVAWILEEATKTAVYCGWEDLHWADPSTLEMLTLFLDRVPTTRALALLTFRPEFSPPWPLHSYMTPISLSRLGRSEVEAMIERISGGKALPAQVVEQVVAKTDGMPIFVEELTKMVLESDLLVTVNGNYALRGRLSELTIPATLQDSLMARLDRLAGAKEVAQLGATVGREFSAELVHAISPWDAVILEQGLEQLAGSELVRKRGPPSHVQYLFEHALVRDMAYQSLLKRTRQQYHQQIARVLEEQFAEVVETQPELLAYHYTEAGQKEQAIAYWQRAGQRATGRSANVEAISHLSKALELLHTLPDTAERAQQELALQVALGVPLMATKGYGAPEVEQTYRRARELCRQAGETPQLFPSLSGLARFYYVRAEVNSAQELGEQCLRLADQVHAPDLFIEACRLVGASVLLRGEFVLAKDHLEKGIALYDTELLRSHTLTYGTDPGLVCLCHLSYVFWCLGFPDLARKTARQAVDSARNVAHTATLAGALHFAATVSLFCQDASAVKVYAQEAVTLSTEYGLAFFLALGKLDLGWAMSEQGQEEKGISQMNQSLDAFRATGAGLWLPSFLSLLAEARIKTGQVEHGHLELTEALRVMSSSGERWWEAELYRLKGELTLQSRAQSPIPSVQQEAEKSFHKAIGVARHQQAKSLELRAATGLARLWQSQGKRVEGHALLSEIYNWFTEGFDTKDMKDAKALLEEMG